MSGTAARNLHGIGVQGYSDEVAVNPRILLSFVGYRDPHPEGSEEYGPLLSLLELRKFDRVVLFCTGGDYLERARSVQQIVEIDDPAVQFSFVNFELDSPVDYEEIYTALRTATAQVLRSVEHRSPQLSVLLDPGTPQMQTSWFLLVGAGEIDATLLQGVPPRFAGGVYKVKEIRLDSGVLPEIRTPQNAQSKAGRSRSTRSTVRSRERGDGELAIVSAPQATEWLNTGGVNIVGRAKVFTDVLEKAARVAQYDISILIRGETGTGKGLVARLIHSKSSRVGSAFLALNCSAIAASLAESELFGHVKGAFTGAATDRLGQFRAADGGTIFLDEIGDLPLDLQPKLLRVLEEKVVVPVGQDTPVPVDVRVIAATNKELEEMIEQGTFRRDLYERLNQTTLLLPPLRERPEDIRLLVERFLGDWNARYHEAKEIEPEALDCLCRYSWPGNVRELENAIIAICASARTDRIGPELLPPAIAPQRGSTNTTDSIGLLGDLRLPEEGVNLRALLSNAERSLYEKALERTSGNAEQAASLLGISGHAFRKAWRERFGKEG